MGLESTFLLDTGDDMPSNIVTAIFIDDLSSSNPVLYAGTQGGGIAVIKVSYQLSWWELNAYWVAPLATIGIVLGIIVSIYKLFIKDR